MIRGWVGLTGVYREKKLRFVITLLMVEKTRVRRPTKWKESRKVKTNSRTNNL